MLISRWIWVERSPDIYVVQKIHTRILCYAYFYPPPYSPKMFAVYNVIKKNTDPDDQRNNARWTSDL